MGAQTRARRRNLQELQTGGIGPIHRGNYPERRGHNRFSADYPYRDNYKCVRCAAEFAWRMRYTLDSAELAPLLGFETKNGCAGKVGLRANHLESIPRTQVVTKREIAMLQ